MSHSSALTESDQMLSGPSRAPISRSPLSIPISPPPHPSRSRPESIFSRLRRTAIPIPMSATSHLAQADSIPTMPLADATNPPVTKIRKDKRASRKALPPPLPPHQSVLDEDEQILDEAEWERIRTLPRVRLIPPEGGKMISVTLHRLSC